MSTRRSSDRAEAGQALIVAVLAFGILVGMAALAIDVGFAFEERRSLQNAADAAALAGARGLPANPALAETRARSWAANNGISEADQLSVEISTTYVANDTIGVRVGREISYRFASVIGVPGISISAQATARTGSPGGLDHFIPLAVEANTLSGLNPGDDAVLKYDSQDQTNGNSLALAFDGSSGASDFRDAIYTGSDQSFCIAGQEYAGCTSTISTEPGGMVGPTRQGINDLLQDTSTTCDTFEEVFQADTENPANVRFSSACNPFPPYNVATSKRVVIVPVIQGLCGGRCDVQIVRFALFFVDGIHCAGGQGSCEITGQYAEAAFDTGSLRLAPYNGDSAFTLVRLIE